MKKLLLPAAAIAFSFSAHAALAADLAAPKGPPAYYLAPSPAPALWTGLTAGLNIGGGWSANSSAGGVVGGGQIGYNYQFGPGVVAGVEADFQGSSVGSSSGGSTVTTTNVILLSGMAVPLPVTGSIGGDGAGTALNWLGTARGRAGYAITPSLLLYGTGGFAYGQVQGNLTGITSTRTGWTAGGGVEWLFLPNWSAKAEYLFADLSSGGTTGLFGFDYGYHHHPQYNIVRGGLNYHFNFGNVATLSAIDSPVVKPAPTVPYNWRP